MGGWPVGYLHNAVEELNSGLPRTNPDSSRVEDLKQGPPDFKSSALKPLGHAASTKLLEKHWLNALHWKVVWSRLMLK